MANVIEMSQEDKDLDEMFHGDPKPLHPDTVYISPEKPQAVPKKIPVDASWEPTPPDPNWLDKLKACVKHAAIYGGLSFLVFYWQQAELMDSSIAIPTMCVCAALAGLGVGKNVHR